uniref:Uncharacterized protein n=1 Tax=Oryza nivara TaxID=4536 RepID=A0A0E0G1A9_ORYNI
MKESISMAENSIHLWPDPGGGRSSTTMSPPFPVTRHHEPSSSRTPHYGNASRCVSRKLSAVETPSRSRHVARLCGTQHYIKEPEIHRDVQASDLQRQ